MLIATTIKTKAIKILGVFYYKLSIGVDGHWLVLFGMLSTGLIWFYEFLYRLQFYCSLVGYFDGFLTVRHTGAHGIIMVGATPHVRRTHEASRIVDRPGAFGKQYPKFQIQILFNWTVSLSSCNMFLVLKCLREEPVSILSMTFVK